MTATIGEVLYSIRVAKKLSLRKVSTRAGISDAGLSLIENDRTADPKFSTVVRLAEVLGISVENLAEIVRRREES